MKCSMVIAGMFSISTISPSAWADTTTISTGGVYGGPQQSTAYCYVFNVDSADYYFGSAELIKQDGTPVPNSHATCDPGTHAPFSVILAKETCQASASIEKGSAYGCRWTVLSHQKGVKPNLRGTMDIRDAAEHVLASSPLR